MHETRLDRADAPPRGSNATGPRRWTSARHTSEAHPTVFGPISLVGIALSGVAWIRIGVEIVLSPRPGPDPS
jgi:hypothetical protein